MSENESTSRPDRPADEDQAAPQAPEPRGNPATDEESVEKGKEQLDKIAGN